MLPKRSYFNAMCRDLSDGSCICLPASLCVCIACFRDGMTDCSAPIDNGSPRSGSYLGNGVAVAHERPLGLHEPLLDLLDDLGRVLRPRVV